LIKTLCPASTWPARRQTKGRVGGERNSSGLLKAKTGWHRGHDFLRCGDILPDNRAGFPEDVVARPPPGYASAHRLHGASEVGIANPDLRASATGRRRIEQASKPGLPAHNVPVAHVDRRGFNPDQYLVVAENGGGDIIYPEDIRRAVAILDERSHIPLRMPQIEPPLVATIGDDGSPLRHCGTALASNVVGPGAALERPWSR
jgi:hypothetical protein